MSTKNSRDTQTLTKIAQAFGKQQNPEFEAARLAMQDFVKTFGNARPEWAVTRATVENYFNALPPSFPLRSQAFITGFLEYLKERPESVRKRTGEFTSHYDAVIGRSLDFARKREKQHLSNDLNKGAPIYPDTHGTVKIFQNRMEYFSRESLEVGLAGKYITFRKPIGSDSLADEVSIEYIDIVFANKNFFVTWHVRIDGALDTFKGSVILTGNSLWFYTFNAAKGGRFRILQTEANFWRHTEREHVDGMLLSEKPSFNETSGAARTTLIFRLPTDEDHEFETRVKKNTGRRNLNRINELRYKLLATEHLFKSPSEIDNRRANSD